MCRLSVPNAGVHISSGRTPLSILGALHGSDARGDAVLLLDTRPVHGLTATRRHRCMNNNYCCCRGSVRCSKPCTRQPSRSPEPSTNNSDVSRCFDTLGSRARPTGRTSRAPSTGLFDGALLVHSEAALCSSPALSVRHPFSMSAQHRLLTCPGRVADLLT